MSDTHRRHTGFEWTDGMSRGA